MADSAQARGRFEILIGAGATAMALGAFTAHLVAPNQVADRYGWAHDRWYQREIGALNLGLAVGVIHAARGRDNEAFLVSWGTSAIAIGATRAAAVASGARGGRLNRLLVIEDVALGVGALALARRRAFAAGRRRGR